MERIWCIVPAAGIGSRMQKQCPKQYLPFRSSTILDITLSRLLACQLFEKIIVCLKSSDRYWADSRYANDDRIIIADGGVERADSVLNGLDGLKQHANSSDWVLVHDAARPCIRRADIECLVDTAVGQQQGAILAAPIHDTVKLVKGGVSTKTLDRSVLWRALTPQIFTLDKLQQALISARKAGRVVTDEASAMEQSNHIVNIVQGHADNIKITCPEDLVLANFYMDLQEQKICE